MADKGSSHNLDAARSMLAVLPATGLCIMTHSRHRIRIAALAALPLLLLLAGPAGAQDQRSSGGFLDNLFSRGDQPPQRQAEPPSQAQGVQPRVAQADI